MESEKTRGLIREAIDGLDEVLTILSKIEKLEGLEYESEFDKEFYRGIRDLSDELLEILECDNVDEWR